MSELLSMMMSGEKKEKYIYGTQQAIISLPAINNAYTFKFKGKINFVNINVNYGYFACNYNSRTTDLFRIAGIQISNIKGCEFDKRENGNDNYLSRLLSSSSDGFFNIEYNLTNPFNTTDIKFLVSNQNLSNEVVSFSSFEILDNNNNKLLSVKPYIKNNIIGVYDSISNMFYTNTKGTLHIVEY